MLKVEKQKKNRKTILREEKLKKAKTSRSIKDEWEILRIIKRSNGKN